MTLTLNSPHVWCVPAQDWLQTVRFLGRMSATAETGCSGFAGPTDRCDQIPAVHPQLCGRAARTAIHRVQRLPPCLTNWCCRPLCIVLNYVQVFIPEGVSERGVTAPTQTLICIVLPDRGHACASLLLASQRHGGRQRYLSPRSVKVMKQRRDLDRAARALELRPRRRKICIAFDSRFRGSKTLNFA